MCFSRTLQINNGTKCTRLLILYIQSHIFAIPGISAINLLQEGLSGLVSMLLWIASGPKYVPFEILEYGNVKKNDAQPSNTAIYLVVSLLYWKCCVRMEIFMTHNMHVWMTIDLYEQVNCSIYSNTFSLHFSGTLCGPCEPTPCNILEEWRPKLHHGGNSKPHTLILDDGMLGSFIWSNKFITGFSFLMTKANQHSPKLWFWHS